MSKNLISSEKYEIFESNLVIHYKDPHFESAVSDLIISQHLTRNNYRDFQNYDRQLTLLAQEIHETNMHYLGNSFNLSFATIFQDGTKSDIVLSQIAKYENKSLKEVKTMKYVTKAKKSGTIMLKEMILASIETKLTQD